MGKLPIDFKGGGNAAKGNSTQESSAEALLTPRQLEIFQLLARGLSNKEICTLLSISSNTVKIHVAAILRALGVANRTEAVFAYQHLLETKNVSRQSQNVQFVDRMGRPALALMPLELLAEPSPELTYLSRGLEEELIARLSLWQWFPVVSLASSRQAAQRHRDPVALGDALQARYLLTGTLRAGDTSMRATLHLLETQQGNTLWSRNFDFPNADLFSVQTQVAKEVITMLAPELISAETNLSRYRARAELTVWENVCRGAWHMHRLTAADSASALDYFDQAIKQDDGFGLAYNGKVSTHQNRLYQQWAGDREATVEDLLASAEAALRLEPRASFAHSCAGLSHILLGERVQAMQHLDEAVKLNPSSTRALNMLGQAYGMSGDLDQCIMHMEDLLRIDPCSSSSFIYHNVIGMCHYQANRFTEGIRWSESSLALNPKATGAYVSLIAAQVEDGNIQRAQATRQQLDRHAPDFRLQGLLDMMRAFTQPAMLERISEALAVVGIRQ